MTTPASAHPAAVAAPPAGPTEPHAALQRLPSREQLLYWLQEAGEIEHNLMCCYLYTAFSLKRDDPAWSQREREAVARWRRSITSVALEEMSHLALVGNLVNALGGAPQWTRPAFPVDPGPYPADFVIRLTPFDLPTIEHFKYLERPGHERVADGAGFEPARVYHRAIPPGRLSPGPWDYDTVGALYSVLDRALQSLVEAEGEAAVFLGHAARQVDAALAPLPGVAAVTDLASARAAIATIVSQGEGAGTEHADSHFMRFCAIADELAACQAANPDFQPAWPAAVNPVMNPPIQASAERVHVSHPGQAGWLDIGNALYTTALRCLLQGFAATERPRKAAWLAASFALMRGLVPVGQGLAARPARLDDDSVHAGLTFTPLRALVALPEESAPRVLAERLGQLRERALALPLALVPGESAATWQGVIDLLGQQQEALAALSPAGREPTVRPVADGGAATGEPIGPTGPVIALETSASGAALATQAASSGTDTPLVAPTAGSVRTSTEPASDEDLPATAPEPTTLVAHDAAPLVSPVEHAAGRALTVHFEGQRCIHSRHCVLDASEVFKANTPGEWIFPDAAPLETVIGVAHACPSGAIRYTRHDGGADEAPPPVNQLRIRENGPYAVHAPLRLAGQSDGLRATLCRCGQSARKPWCDGSHATAGFVASGEPPTGDTSPLAVRDGPLAIDPQRDGPLHVHGNLEICAGTGRTVARVTEARLCRCGNSRNKPFCDGTHAVVGFRAAGVEPV